MTTSEPRSLRQRTLKASVWTVFGFGLSQIIRFGSNLLMTRLLLPEMFGVMAIATMVMYGLALFSDVGLRQSIVQSKRGNEVQFLNTAWAIQIFRGALIWLFALLVSLFIFFSNQVGLSPPSSVYANPSLPYVIAILSISAVISGFDSSKVHEASRNLSLHKITQIELFSQVAGLLFMLGWVIIERSIWALVAGNLFSVLARTILSHIWLPGIRNHWHWDVSAFREIINFGKWIFISSIIGFLVNSGDRLLLGGLINSTLLGIYVIAFFLFSSVEQVMTKVIADVSFPALSEVARDRREDLQRTYYRFQIIVASSSYFCAGVLMMSGQTLINLLYDSRYTDAGWMLEILSTALMVAPIHLAIQCFISLGMPKLISYIGAVRLVILFILTPIGFNWFGLPGALWGIVLSYASCWPMTIFYMRKFGLLDLGKELLPLPLFLGGLLVGKVFNFAINN